MVDLVFGDPTTTDLVMAIGTGFIGMVILAIAYKMSVNGTPQWISRKIVHITMGTIIGLTIVGYSNLSGPFLAGLLFLTALIYAWAHKSDLIFELLIAGSREGETKANTFFSGFMGVAAFAIAFLVFSARPEIFVAAILVCNM